ncbi:uncharacterized protein LOC134690187 [Mytilus trossulus]|uniref:uncharacterized protein LOC134690187 n=1 Tax=Mytilus trossulus TaxID=6551 RepID=UPI0030047D62
MNYTDEEPSLELYHYLCNIVGSEVGVKTRRDIYTILDFVQNGNGVLTAISSGSKAEGLDLKGSDIDRMLVIKFFRVYENINNVMNCPLHASILMETTDTKPCFTKLKVYPIFNKIPFFNRMLDTLGEEIFISSKRFRESYLIPGAIIHGPCVSDPEETFDNALSFRCKEWISSAQPWINRPRFTWPDNKLVTSIVQYGVLFVPIGPKHSPYENLEWRISFSMAEKQLIYSFSHTQLLCYALLKIIHKDIIKPKHGDLICSYFLKTILFWLSEEPCPSDWKPESFFSCFLNCLRRLIYCVENKTCLHYFIPEYNLFEDRFTNEQQSILLNTLQLIYISPWNAIFNTSTFQEYKLDSRNAHKFKLTASALPCISYFGHIYDFTYTVFNLFDFNPMKRALTCCINFPDKTLRKYAISAISNRYIQSHFKFISNNKLFYKQNYFIIGTVKIALSSDVLSSWILFASYLYQCKRFKECIYIINYCLSECTPDKILLHLTGRHYSLEQQTVFEIMHRRVGLIAACKNLINPGIIFYYPFILLPIELTRLQTRLAMIYVPSVVYCHVLLFLCFHHLRDYRGKLTARRNLELTIRERYLVSHTDTTFETVYRCLEIVKALL